MPPVWIEVFASIAIAVSLFCSLYLIIMVVRHPQQMAVMNWVWPITALYFGPVAIYAFKKLGRPANKRPPEREAISSGVAGEGGAEMNYTPSMRTHSSHQMGASSDVATNQGARQGGHDHHEMSRRPFWQSVWVGVTHCGAGCTLGDLIAEWTIFAVGFTLAGTAFWPNIMLDYTLALLLGIVFQYFAIAPMRGISGWPGIWAATKADVLSLTAFEVGLFAWMALSTFVFFPQVGPDNPVYWFMMQIGMVIGFGTSYPMNWWLIRRGIKEAM